MQVFRHPRRSWRLAIVAMALTAVLGCKAKHDGAPRDASSLDSAIEFDGQSISLDNYIATPADYEGMKAEFRAMALVNDGKPNYDDGVAKINQLRPNFQTIAGHQLYMEEAVALLVWTVGNIGTKPPFERINRALRSPSAIDDRAIASTVRTLASAVNKLRGRTCQAVRGVRSLPASYLRLRAGETFKDPGFVAFGLGAAPPAPFNASPIWIHVTSPRCKVIAEFSKYGSEDEVLFPPGTDFTVLTNSADSGRGRFQLSHGGGPSPVDGGSAPTFNAKNFVGKTFSGVDAIGTRRRIDFMTDGKATYVGVAGMPQDIKWNGTGDKIELTLADGRKNWYTIVSNAKICYSGETAAGSATAICLSLTEADEEGNGGDQPAQITYRDLIGKTYLSSGRRLILGANQRGSYFNGTSNAAIRWVFLDQPPRVRIESGGRTFWYRVSGPDEVCPAGEQTYQPNAGGACYRVP